MPASVQDSRKGRFLYTHFGQQVYKVAENEQACTKIDACECTNRSKKSKLVYKSMPASVQDSRKRSFLYTHLGQRVYKVAENEQACIQIDACECTNRLKRSHLVYKPSPASVQASRKGSFLYPFRALGFIKSIRRHTVKHLTKKQLPSDQYGWQPQSAFSVNGFVRSLCAAFQGSAYRPPDLVPVSSCFYRNRSAAFQGSAYRPPAIVPGSFRSCLLLN